MKRKDKVFIWLFIIMGSLEILISVIEGNFYMFLIGILMFISAGYNVIISRYIRIIESQDELINYELELINKYQKQILEMMEEKVNGISKL